MLKDANLFNSRVVSDLVHFKSEADVTAANRITAGINDVVRRVYGRYLYGSD